MEEMGGINRSGHFVSACRRLALDVAQTSNGMVLETSIKEINMMNGLAWLVFLISALLEVGGDAMVRKGLRGAGLAFILLGMLMLGGYGILVNTVKWDFSKLLGVYVAVFAAVSVLFGMIVFKETIPLSTWIGLGLIISGGLVIQF